MSMSVFWVCKEVDIDQIEDALRLGLILPDFQIEALCKLAQLGLAKKDAPIAWAGRNKAGQWFACQDWQDADHVKLHLSGFGDESEKAKIHAVRVRLIPLAPPES